MEYHHFVIARALHILGIVLWIGGVAFVTTVLIPAIRHNQSPDNQLSLFELLEGKFSFQAKLSTLLTGISGFYMLHFMDAWGAIVWWVYLSLIHI